VICATWVKKNQITDENPTFKFLPTNHSCNQPKHHIRILIELEMSYETSKLALRTESEYSSLPTLNVRGSPPPALVDVNDVPSRRDPT
jgi:hypothetical protein